MGGGGGGGGGSSGDIRATQKRRGDTFRALTAYIRIDTAHTAKANVATVISNPAFFSEQAKPHQPQSGNPAKPLKTGTVHAP
jgi:hypothetical protein